jgi:flagellar protein FliO/FliZ
MEIAEFLRAGAALLFTVGLMLCAYIGFQRLGPWLRTFQPDHTTRRLAVTQTLPLDARRKLVVIRFQDKEHLVLTGPSGDLIISEHAISEASLAIGRSVKGEGEAA